MAQQNPRLAGTPTEAAATLLAATSDPSNPAVNELIRLMSKRLARDEREVEEQEITARNMRRQNAEAMERKHQDEIAFQARCDHMTEHRDRASIVGQRAHSGKYILLCSKCSKIWNGAEEVPPGLNNLIRWEWIGGPQ